MIELVSGLYENEWDWDKYHENYRLNPPIIALFNQIEEKRHDSSVDKVGIEI